jgi:eukaryotic-like serine/threonine-protein kinase
VLGLPAGAPGLLESHGGPKLVRMSTAPRSPETSTAVARFGVEGEDAAAFLQRRVANMGLFASLFGTSFLLLRIVIATIGRDTDHLTSPSLYLHAASILPAWALWLVCRKGSRPIRFLETAELSAVTLASWLLVATGVFMPLLMMPPLLVAFVGGAILTVRATYVPSTPRRTLWLGVIVGVPYLVMTYYVTSRWTPDLVASARAIFGKEVPDLPVLPVAAGWWAVNIAISTAASYVIYGLREKVREVQQLGQYHLEEKLGEGGMGVIYRARHALLQRPTAIKLLSEEQVGATSLQRFEQEVRHTARLTHPNTITIYDYGRTPDGVFYYAMELLEGATLDAVVRHDGPMRPGRVLHILRQIAGSLGEAHAIGLVHRDIKPENVMLCHQGGAVDVVKVLDFGLVKQVHAGDDASLTGTNMVVGTPQYMAPEAILSSAGVDARADLYSLAATGYYLLTGRDLFRGATIMEVCGHHLHTEPTPPSELVDGIPSDLEAIVLRCLAKKPADRPKDARELLHLLAPCEDHGWSAEEAPDEPCVRVDLGEEGGDARHEAGRSQKARYVGRDAHAERDERDRVPAAFVAVATLVAEQVVERELGLVHTK